MSSRNKHKSAQGRLASFFELPKDILLDLPRITIIGTLQICLENHRGIIEYTDERIRVSLEGKELMITGSSLTIGAINAAEIIVEGNIAGLNFR